MLQIPADFYANRTKYGYLVGNYDITPVRQFKLLPGKPAEGLYLPLKDVVFQFTASKKGGGPLFWFNTGYHNGAKLLAAMNATMPPLETWAAALATPGPGPGPAVPPAPPGPAAPGAVCAFNAALLQLLNLFFLKYAFDPLKPSADIYKDIHRQPHVENRKGAFGVNTILVTFGETATGLEQWLQAQVGAANVRKFNFTILSNYLHNHKNKPQNIAI